MINLAALFLGQNDGAGLSGAETGEVQPGFALAFAAASPQPKLATGLMRVNAAPTFAMAEPEQAVLDGSSGSVLPVEPLADHEQLQETEVVFATTDQSATELHLEVESAVEGVRDSGLRGSEATLGDVLARSTPGKLQNLDGFGEARSLLPPGAAEVGSSARVTSAAAGRVPVDAAISRGLDTGQTPAAAVGAHDPEVKTASPRFAVMAQQLVEKGQTTALSIAGRDAGVSEETGTGTAAIKSDMPAPAAQARPGLELPQAVTVQSLVANGERPITSPPPPLPQLAQQEMQPLQVAQVATQAKAETFVLAQSKDSLNKRIEITPKTVLGQSSSPLAVGSQLTNVSSQIAPESGALSAWLTADTGAFAASDSIDQPLMAIARPEGVSPLMRGSEQVKSPSDPGPKRFTEAITSQIRAAEVSEGRTRIELNPRGLGNIDIDILVERDGALRVLVRAENPTVLTSLRDGQGLLTEAIGLSDKPSFEFQQRSSDDHQQQKEVRQNGQDAEQDLSETGPSQPEPNHNNLIDGRQLDIVT